MNPRDRNPQIRVDAARKDPRIDGSNSGWRAVDSNFRLAERRASAALQFIDQTIRNAGVPELVDVLPLGKNIEVSARDISRKSQSLFQQAGGAAEANRAAGRSTRERDNLGEIGRNLIRFDAAAEDMRVGKLSGAVGVFGHLKPEHEERICTALGLKPALVATQVIQRDRHAAYISTLALIGSKLDKIALEIRHLQRTEVREAQEYFSEKQKGSSAMPHKKNPITSEQISGLARVLRGNAQAAFENVPLWHERDISHSSVERVIFPDSTILVDYLLAKTTDLIDRLLVYPERMKRNLESTGGLIFSGQLLLDLAEAGMMREDAYRLVQSHAMRAWKEDLTFREEVARDPAITKLLSPEKLDQTFDYMRQLDNVDAIFQRVLGS